MAVMAEFLARGYNVAVPEVDRGDDLFVVRDDNGELSRIQVKSASAAYASYFFEVHLLSSNALRSQQIPFTAYGL